jgi:hypothetical protein
MYSNLEKKVVSTFLILFILLMNQSILAETPKIGLILYSGNVTFIDEHFKKHIPNVGTFFSVSDFQQVELELESQIYLQINDKMIHINQAGVYEIAGLLEKDYSILSNALSFLELLVSPRTFVSQKIARGNTSTLDQQNSDDIFFENLWQDIAGEPESQISQLNPKNMIACAAWFQKKQQPARVAYILERLDGLTGRSVPLFQTMRNDSFRGITLIQINHEVEKTRRQIALNLSSLDYKALLIGIDHYNHPEWQNLENPVHDIQSIKEILIKDYFFQPEGVITLKNANFEDIINAFNKLKSIVNENTNLLIYYAGHGFYPKDEEEGYWIPKDAGNISTQKMFIPTSIVLSKVKAIPAKHILLVADSCFSGSLVRKTRGVIGQSKFYRELVKKRSRQIITSGGLEPVNDLGGSNHSIFAAKLIQFLKNDFKDPLSASELALNLRKEIKNSGEQQTPEYGRLNTFDDENGEFFFVKRGQTVLPEPEIKKSNVQNIESVESTEEIKDEKEPWLDLGFFSFKFKGNEGIERDPSIRAFQSHGEEDWVGIGLDVKMFTIKYEKSETAESNWTNTKTDFTGLGVKNELRFSNDGLGYGVTFYLGRLYSAKDEMSSSAQEDIDDEEDNTRISGTYAGTGFFVDHTIIFIGGFSLQLGGAFEYHYMRADNVFNEDNVTSNTMSTCFNLNAPYRFEAVTVQPYFNACPYVYQTSGNLEDVSNNEVKEAIVTNITSVGVLASFNF